MPANRSQFGIRTLLVLLVLVALAAGFWVRVTRVSARREAIREYYTKERGAFPCFETEYSAEDGSQRLLSVYIEGNRDYLVVVTDEQAHCVDAAELRVPYFVAELLQASEEGEPRLVMNLHDMFVSGFAVSPSDYRAVCRYRLRGGIAMLGEVTWTNPEWRQQFSEEVAREIQRLEQSELNLPTLYESRQVVLPREGFHSKALEQLVEADVIIDEVVLPTELVSDETLVRLSRLTSLRVLDLSYAPISDEGLASLAKLANLQTLNLSNSLVSPAAVARLQKALPNCRIEYCESPSRQKLRAARNR